MKRKDYTIQALLFCFGLACLFNIPGCYEGKTQDKGASFKYAGYETSDTNYRYGQILYPDMVHSDTLIVTNADSLNWCFENYDIASDGDINDVLRAYCRPLKSLATYHIEIESEDSFSLYKGEKFIGKCFLTDDSEIGSLIIHGKN